MTSGEHLDISSSSAITAARAARLATRSVAQLHDVVSSTIIDSQPSTRMPEDALGLSPDQQLPD